jgi:type I restriction enzyme S subunit
MIHDLKPYLAYKASGVPGLGPVPEHWEVRRLKTIFREVDERTQTGTEPLLSLRQKAGLVDYHDSGGKPISPEALVRYKKARPGQLVMNRMRAASGLFGVPPHAGLVSPDYAVFSVVGSLCLKI